MAATQPTLEELRELDETYDHQHGIDGITLEQAWPTHPPTVAGDTVVAITRLTAADDSCPICNGGAGAPCSWHFA